MPVSLANIGDNITKHYLEARQSLVQLANDLIDPVHSLLTQLDITCTPPVFPEPLTFIDYPQSFYPQTNYQEESYRLFKERIQTLRAAKPLLNSVHSSLTNNTNYRFLVAYETERRAYKYLYLVNAEKQRLDELNNQLTTRQTQLRDYEYQIIKYQQKVQMEIQAAGAKFKQKLLEEVNVLKQEKFAYEQEFAMQKAYREQELLDLYSYLNQTKKVISDLSLQREEVYMKHTMQHAAQQKYAEIQYQASQSAAEEYERLEFLYNHVVDESILAENDTQTLTGQCIQLFKNKECSVERSSDRFSAQMQQNALSSANADAQQQPYKLTVYYLYRLAPPLSADNGYAIPAQQKPTPDPVPVAYWAQGELLERCVLATYGINPGYFFKNKGKTSVQELFGISNHPFDMRSRQTQLWGKDKLGAKDYDFYNKGVGWLAE